VDSRENLYPAWADLSARADRAREEFRASDGGYDARFRFMHALYRLGYEARGIQHEMAENQPNPQTGPGS
jgi:hypothetical protein